MEKFEGNGQSKCSLVMISGDQVNVVTRPILMNFRLGGAFEEILIGIRWSLLEIGAILSQTVSMLDRMLAVLIWCLLLPVWARYACDATRCRM